MQPFVNPNYFNGYTQPYQSPYQSQYQAPYNNPAPATPAVQTQNMGQINSPFQKYSMPGINGRVVNDFNEIIADDVPTNGTYAVFVKNDMSEIQARTWAADGKIVSVAFKPVLEPQNNNSTPEPQKAVVGLSDEVTEAFMNRFDDIMNKIDVLEEIVSKQTNVGRRKKEADSE